MGNKASIFSLRDSVLFIKEQWCYRCKLLAWPSSWFYFNAETWCRANWTSWTTSRTDASTFFQKHQLGHTTRKTDEHTVRTVQLDKWYRAQHLRTSACSFFLYGATLLHLTSDWNVPQCYIISPRTQKTTCNSSIFQIMKQVICFREYLQYFSGNNTSVCVCVVNLILQVKLAGRSPIKMGRRSLVLSLHSCSESCTGRYPGSWNIIVGENIERLCQQGATCRFKG